MKRFSWKKFIDNHSKLAEVVFAIAGVSIYCILCSVWWGVLLALLFMAGSLLCWGIGETFYSSKKWSFLGHLGGIGIIAFLLLGDGYMYESSSSLWCFLGISVAIGLVLGAVAFLFSKSKKASSRWGSAVWVLVIAAIFVWSALPIINMKLDFSRPRVERGTVTDKNRIHIRRVVDKYYLYAEIDDEEQKLEVSSGDYNKIDEEDLVHIGHYEGALGQPYYRLIGYTPAEQQGGY